MRFLRWIANLIRRLTLTTPPTTRSGSVGIEMPAGFPLAEYDAVSARVCLEARRAANPNEVDGFAQAWNGLAYRYRTCADANVAFTSSITANAMPPSDERLRQEQWLFDFFVTGHSCLENLSYASYAMGAILAPATFPYAMPAHLRAITPERTARLFSTTFGSTRLAASLVGLTADNNFIEWGVARNVLAHRGAPPRRVFMTIGAQAVVDQIEWQGLSIDVRTTSVRYTWLGAILSDCILAAHDFASSHL